MNLDHNITYRKKDNGIQVIISYKLNNKWRQKSKQGFEKLFRFPERNGNPWPATENCRKGFKKVWKSS